MTKYLPSSSPANDKESSPSVPSLASGQEAMADLKVFWGPEICRLEYLVHLMDTGRIKDEQTLESA